MDVKDLSKRLASLFGRDAEDMRFLADSMFGIIVDAVRDGDTVSIPGFGNFESKIRDERITVHPSSGKKLLVPPKISFVFKPSAILKQKAR